MARGRAHRADLEASSCDQDGGLPRSWRSTHDEPEEHHISEPRINDRIRVAEVRLVGPNGEQVGIVRVEDALRLAQDADLDLVEVAPDARPPVCKIMDYGKFKYEADMKAREARRNQTNTVLKEIRFRLKIDPHDYGTKKGHVERFLTAGDKVKVMIMFRGREQSRPEMGVRLLQRLADDVSELGFIESMPKQDGRNMIMVLGPNKKKADQKQEQRRAAQAAAAREAERRGCRRCRCCRGRPGRAGRARRARPPSRRRSSPRPPAVVETPPRSRPRPRSTLRSRRAPRRGAAAVEAPAPVEKPAAAPRPAASRPSAPRPPAPAAAPRATPAPRPAAAPDPPQHRVPRPLHDRQPQPAPAAAATPSQPAAPRPQRSRRRRSRPRRSRRHPGRPPRRGPRRVPARPAPAKAQTSTTASEEAS